MLFQDPERSGIVDGRALRGTSLPIGRPLHAKSIGHFFGGRRSPGMDEGGTLLIEAAGEPAKFALCEMKRKYTWRIKGAKESWSPKINGISRMTVLKED